MHAHAGLQPQSHLEFVNPVVEGTRPARKPAITSTTTERSNAACPLLIHGDAAFIGQGVVAETLNLARLAGLHHRRHHPRGGQQPDRVHHQRPSRVPQRRVLHRHRQDDPVRRSSTSTATTSTRSPARRRDGRWSTAQQFAQRRGHRHVVLPQVRPQRGRRAAASRNPLMYERIQEVRSPSSPCTAKSSLATRACSTRPVRRDSQEAGCDHLTRRAATAAQQQERARPGASSACRRVGRHTYGGDEQFVRARSRYGRPRRPLRPAGVADRKLGERIPEGLHLIRKINQTAVFTARASWPRHPRRHSPSTGRMGELLAYGTLLVENGTTVRLTGQDAGTRHLQPPARRA